MLPMQSVDLAIDEMRYARQELGMRGDFLRPNPLQRPVRQRFLDSTA